MGYIEFAISIAIIGLILLWGARRKKLFLDSFRGAAEETYAHLLVEFDDPSFAFDGITGEILSEKEEVEQSGGALLAYQMTRIVKNPAGEYFYYRYRSDSKPYFKQLEHGTAKMLLGKKYIPKPC